MEGVIGESFEITGRGVVTLLESYDGEFRVGDFLAVGDQSWVIVGFDIPRQANASGSKPAIGVLLKDARKQDLVSVLGRRFITSKRPA